MEIDENLIRNELTAQQRDEHIAKKVELLSSRNSVRLTEFRATTRSGGERTKAITAINKDGGTELVCVTSEFFNRGNKKAVVYIDVYITALS
jgi:hypothetical protein